MQLAVKFYPETSKAIAKRCHAQKTAWDYAVEDDDLKSALPKLQDSDMDDDNDYSHLEDFIDG